MSAPSCTQLHLVLCTCPNTDCADRIARILVLERLAACVTQWTLGQSTSLWNQQLVTEPEVQLMIKTTSAILPVLWQRLADLHPFDVPEAIALPINTGLPAYMNWVMQQTRSSPTAS